MEYKAKIQNAEYRTKDIYLASFLLTHAYQLKTLLQAEEGKFVFVFRVEEDKEENAESLIADYYNRTTVSNGTAVELIDYIIAQKQIKSRMYNYATIGG